MKIKGLFVLGTLLLCISMTACGKGKNVDTDDAVLELDESLFTAEITPTPSTGQTLDDILGTAKATVTPTATPTPVSAETPALPTETPTLDSSDLADDLFSLLGQKNDLTDVTASDLLAIDAMTIFANNIKNNNYIGINKSLHEMQLNTRECTVLSRAENGSIVKFISNTDTNKQTVLVVYVTDLTAWTVIGDDDVIYALMPTPESNSTEYEKQIMQAIMNSYSNGKDLHIEFLYPYSSVFDTTNNCACYMITTDGTFNVGSNAKTFAFYKYDFTE